MKVGYIQRNSEGVVEQVIHSTHDSREEAHVAAIALADSLVGNDNIFEVVQTMPLIFILSSESSLLIKIGANIYGDV